MVVGIDKLAGATAKGDGAVTTDGGGGGCDSIVVSVAIVGAVVIVVAWFILLSLCNLWFCTAIVLQNFKILKAFYTPGGTVGRRSASRVCMCVCGAAEEMN